MGDRFWFFTDPGFLKPQTPSKAFGPAGVQGTDDVFRVTHWHDANADAPAIAVCDGILCVQPDGPDTLTLILKPSQAPPFEAPVVRYFIYKGVKRASLLAGNAVIESANDLTERVAESWLDYNSSLAGSQAALGLDRDANYPPDDGTNPPKIFTDNDLIERLFTFPHPDHPLPQVAAGDRIGLYKGECGFEIVLNRLGYRPKLGFARSADNVLSTGSVAATNGGAAWQADDAAWFAHWHDAECALAFLDPAAYFGAFVQSKLYRKGAILPKVKGSKVYEDLLATFHNKNVAWLDIRDNYGLSYNLLGLRGDVLRFAAPDGSASNDVAFRSQPWPLRKLTIADVRGVRRKAAFRTSLALQSGLSKAPALLISKGFAKDLRREGPELKVPPIAADMAAPGFLERVSLALPAAEENGADILTASYTRINLYERLSYPPSAQPLPIGQGEFLDGIFRVVDLRLDTDFAGFDLRFDVYEDEILVDLGESDGPAYAATVGVAEDHGFTTLFAYPSHFLPVRQGVGEAEALPSWSTTATDGRASLIEKFASAFPSTKIAKRTFQPDNQLGEMDVITVQERGSSNYDGVAGRNALTSFCFIVLDALDHATMVTQAAADPALGAAFAKFLTVATSQTKRDPIKGVTYFDKFLRVSGFAPQDTKVVPAHAGVTQEVYGDADL